MFIKSLSFITFIVLSINSFSQYSNENYSLLWEVTGNNIKEKSYIFGSIHRNNKILFSFPDSLYHALYSSETLAIEADLFSMTEIDVRRGEIPHKFNRKGGIYSKSNEPSKTAYGDEDGMPQFIDAYFQEYANNIGMNVKFLETVEEQLSLFSDLSFNFSLKGAWEKDPDIEKKMKALYLKGDSDGLYKLTKNSFRYNQDYFEDFIPNRNKRMADSLELFMNKSSVFCVVGAAHLAGKDGLIDLMRKKNFKVRRVIANYSDTPIEEKAQIKETKDYVFHDTIIGLKAVFPGKPIVTKELESLLPDYVQSKLNFTPSNSSIVEIESTILKYTEFGQGNMYSISISPSPNLSPEELSDIFISNPIGNSSTIKSIKNNQIVIDGISNTYPEGIHYVRIIQSNKSLVIGRTYGGNKFMSSNRHKKFLGNIWLYK